MDSIEKLMSSYIKGNFLRNFPIVEAGPDIPPQFESSAFTGTFRNLNDILETVCWISSEEHIYYVRFDSLMHSDSKQGRFKLKDNIITNPHKHNSVELAYVVKGKLKQNISGKDVEFSEGEICMIDKNSMHYDYLYPDGSMVVFISITDSFISRSRLENRKYAGKNIDGFLRDVMIRNREKFSYIRFTPGEGLNQETPELIAGILSELWNSRCGSTLIIQGCLERLLSLLPVEYSFSLTRDERSYIRELLFKEITEYMKEHYYHIAIEDLSARFNYNEDYFNRLIKEFAGMTYSRYLQEIRLDKAVNLLQTTEISIENIAHAVGYNNVGYFYKIFFNKYRKKPGDYRAI